MEKDTKQVEPVEAFAEKLEEEELQQGEQVDVSDDPLFGDMIIEEDDLALGEMIPTMNVTPMPVPEPEKCLIADDKLLGLYDEIVQNCRDDRAKVNQIQANFEDMVVNDGDATSASKEALVNLMKIKTDINDKLSKVADLMTRHVLKSKDTFPRYLAAHQHNNVTIENSSKRDILKSLQQQQAQRW